MKNTMKCFGIIALVALTIGFSFVGCDNGSGGGVLAAPTGLTATPVSSTEINIFWNAVPGAAGYNVYSSLNASAGFTLLGTSTTNSAANTNIQPSTTYYYRVAAYSANGTEGAMSGTASATTPSGSSGGPRLTISNISTQAIHYVFISLSPTDVGNDWLGPTEVINAGASRTFQLASTGTYHISVVGVTTSQVAVKVYYPITGNQTLYFIGFGSELGTTNTPTPSLSLDGVWVQEGGRWEVTVTGSTGVVSAINWPSTDPLGLSAENKGYFKVGTTIWRNLSSKSSTTWSGDSLGLSYKDSAPTVATGTGWYYNVTFTLSNNGQTLTVGDSPFTRK